MAALEAPTSLNLAPSSFPLSYGVGARAAAPQLVISCPAPCGKTALLSHSTAGSEMMFSTLSFALRWLRSRAWPIAGSGCTTPSGLCVPPGAYALGSNSSICCMTTHSHCAWPNEGSKATVYNPIFVPLLIYLLISTYCQSTLWLN